MWRAWLADGRVVDYSGDNSPTQILPLIVSFRAYAPGGQTLFEVNPGPREFVVWRWVRETDSHGGRRTVGFKAGIVNRDTRQLNVRQFDSQTGDWAQTEDIVLDPAELA